MTKMRVAQVSKAKGDFEFVEREIPSPGPGQVRIKVEACGVCHSDVFTKEGLWPGLQYPRIPGHEVAGVIDEVGSGVSSWRKGDRAGVGWHGGQDNTCPACRAGDFTNCETAKITGITYDGGYQEYMVAPIEAVARIPDGLEAAEAAPLRLRCRVWADLATWASSSQINSATAWPLSDAARKMPCSRKNLARTTILT